MESSADLSAIEPDPAVLRDLWIVVPAFNEEGKIGEVVGELKRLYPNVVVVDDGSADETRARALEAGAVVLRHPINRGQGAALQTGLQYGLLKEAKYLVTFDADGQHPVDALPRLLSPILSGQAEIVLGSRFLQDAGGVPWTRRLLLGAAVLFTRLFSGVRLTDAHNGLRAFSRKAAGMIDIQLDRMAHASEIIDQIRRSGLVFTEVPVRIHYTEYSRAKGQSASAAVRIVFDYFVGRLFR
jgi:glycosyltransferase involved in cell wall biosynthesis